MTIGAGEKRAETAKELLEYLCEGSPALRLVLQEVVATKVLEPLDEERLRSHQKILVAEATPANAFFLQIVLRCALIDARVMHAGLSNNAKAALVEEFNDQDSTFKVLIMMFDVGAVGLNLHQACNKVVITSVARAYAQEGQVAGRILRVSIAKSTFERLC